MIKLAFTAAICVSFSTLPAIAMNWEGHDDWMADLPAAIELQEATTPAVLPLRRSPACRADVPRNAYDQIPLATDMCRAGLTVKGKVRPGAQP